MSPLYAIEYFVGSRFGGWLRGTERWLVSDAAQSAIVHRTQAERQADMTPFARRVAAA